MTMPAIAPGLSSELECWVGVDVDVNVDGGCEENDTDPEGDVVLVDIVVVGVASIARVRT